MFRCKICDAARNFLDYYWQLWGASWLNYNCTSPSINKALSNSIKQSWWSTYGKIWRHKHWRTPVPIQFSHIIQRDSNIKAVNWNLIVNLQKHCSNQSLRLCWFVSELFLNHPNTSLASPLLLIMRYIHLYLHAWPSMTSIYSDPEHMWTRSGEELDHPSSLN